MTKREQDGQVDYVEFRAPDLAAIKRFYSAVFGWRFTDYGPDYTSFSDGRLEGGFHRADAAPGGALVVIYAAELEAVQSKIEAEGGKISKAIFSFPGGRRFHFADPGGNELAVWSTD